MSDLYVIYEWTFSSKGQVFRKILRNKYKNMNTTGEFSLTRGLASAWASSEGRTEKAVTPSPYIPWNNSSNSMSYENPIVQCCIHIDSLIIPILSRIQFLVLTPIYLTSILVLSSDLRLGIPKSILISIFQLTFWILTN